MTVAGGEVKEEGLVRGGSVLRADPVDGAISQVVDQDVVRVADRRQYRNVVLKQCRVKLVRVAAEEPVEVVETQSAGPLVVRPSGALHPLRNQVVLTEPRRVVSVVNKNAA